MKTYKLIGDESNTNTWVGGGLTMGGGYFYCEGTIEINETDPDALVKVNFSKVVCLNTETRGDRVALDFIFDSEIDYPTREPVWEELKVLSEKRLLQWTGDGSWRAAWGLSWIDGRKMMIYSGRTGMTMRVEQME